MSGAPRGRPIQLCVPRDPATSSRLLSHRAVHLVLAVPPGSSSFHSPLLTLLLVPTRCRCDSSCVRLRTPCKIFGDVHGQFADLQRFFSAFGSPNPYTGDVEYVNYLFLGDYVDRGKYSLEVVTFLVALKICHPKEVVLLRGNHEDPQVCHGASSQGAVDRRALCPWRRLSADRCALHVACGVLH